MYLLLSEFKGGNCKSNWDMPSPSLWFDDGWQITNGNRRMAVGDIFGGLISGQVFIGSMMDLWDELRIGGNPICNSSGCVSMSDARLKENVKPIDNSLELILKLKGVRYDWIDKNTYGEGPQIGMIAQDIEKVFPEVVHTNPENGRKSVSYDHLIAPLIEAFKTIVGPGL